MAKSKVIDKEEMYKKIMPTANKQAESTNQDNDIETNINANEFYHLNETSDLNDVNKVATKQLTSFFAKRENLRNKDIGNNFYIYNITEKQVEERLEIALKKMNCCRCDKCKKDIIVFAMNSLTPNYIVCKENEIDEKSVCDDKTGLAITSAILKAILEVRKNPKH